MQQQSSAAFFPARLAGVLSSEWLRPLNDLGAIDELLGRLRPTWSLTRIKAEVVGVVHETLDVCTLVLRPNRNWPGHRAGQHVLLEAEIDGRRLMRSFSLSSAPRADGLVTITVKRRQSGKVSVWCNEKAACGDVVTLSAPMGDFVLPDPLPRRLVMLSAGSGITPLMAMLRDLFRRRCDTRVLFVHCARTPAEMIFAAELERLARTWPQLELRVHYTSTCGRMDRAALARLACEAGDAPTLLCGPDAFMGEARAAWRAAGSEERLACERFGLPARSGDDATTHVVRAERSATTFETSRGGSLLAAAEAAGLEPAYGCRMGICHTCKCRKLSGVVEDLRDGRLSDEPGEMIQLCVSAARSDVLLDL